MHPVAGSFHWPERDLIDLWPAGWRPALESVPSAGCPLSTVGGTPRCGHPRVEDGKPCASEISLCSECGHACTTEHRADEMQVRRTRGGQNTSGAQGPHLGGAHASMYEAADLDTLHRALQPDACQRTQAGWLCGRWRSGSRLGATSCVESSSRDAARLAARVGQAPRGGRGRRPTDPERSARPRGSGLTPPSMEWMGGALVLIFGDSLASRNNGPTIALRPRGRDGTGASRGFASRGFKRTVPPRRVTVGKRRARRAWSKRRRVSASGSLSGPTPLCYGTRSPAAGRGREDIGRRGAGPGNRLAIMSLL